MIKKQIFSILAICILLCLSGCTVSETSSNSINSNLESQIISEISLTEFESNKVASDTENTKESNSTQSKSEIIGETSRIESETNKASSKTENSKESDSSQSKSEIIGETSRIESEINKASSKTEDSEKSNNTQSVSSHTHNYSEATCTTPKKCSCGVTEGDELGHLYSGKYCSRCGISNPYYSEPEWTLQLPNFPQDISYYNDSGQLLSTVRINNITYLTENSFGYRIIMVYFYGEKIYDYKGSGQYTECKINYKLYGPNGPWTLQECTSYLPTLAIGDTFAKSETVLYEDESILTSGTYRLEIMDAYH